MSPSREQISQQTDLELALMRGEITRAELVDRSAALGIPVADYLLEPAPARRYQHQPITITVEQLEKRALWEQMLMRGEVTLDDALAMQMGIGVPIGDYTRQRYASAVDSYKNKDFKDLAEPLGIAMSEAEKNAVIKDLTWRHDRYRTMPVVDAQAEKGLPKSDPSQFDGTAFHAASKNLGETPSRLYNLYYNKKRKQKAKKAK